MSLSRINATTWRWCSTPPFFALVTHFLEHGPQRLGLGLCRHQAFARDQGSDQVAHHGFLVRSVSAKTAALLRATWNSQPYSPAPLLSLHTAERQAALVEFLQYLVQGLLPEVGNSQQVVLRLGHKFPDTY